MENGTLIGDALIASTGEYGNNLGVVELEFQGGKFISKKARLIPAADTANIIPAQEVLDIITQVKTGQEEILAEVIGRTGVFLDGERAHARAMETNLGNLVADAMLEASGADAAITNGGGIRASIDIGEITRGEVVTVLP